MHSFPPVSRLLSVALSATLALFATSASAQDAARPAASAISLDEFLNTTSITAARPAPDGSAVVIGTEAPDWSNHRFRDQLWLWTAHSGLHPLTEAASDSDPRWSPDGKWIAFLSDRPVAADSKAGDATRIWIIAATGGEAQPLYTEKIDAHSFAWSADGATLFLSIRQPISADQQTAEQAEWKDVIRWREQERGDTLLALPLAAARERNRAVPSEHPQKPSESQPVYPAGSRVLGSSPLEIDDITPSPDGAQIAFVTNSVSHRMEDPAAIEIFTLPTSGGAPHPLTHNQALEDNLHWTADSRALHFIVHAAGGSLSGPYRDVQGRLYRMDIASGSITRLGADFPGSWENYDLLADGSLVALGLRGTEQHLYRVSGTHAALLSSGQGSVASVAVPSRSHALVFERSAINVPTQVYFAADAAHPEQATAITQFNPVFAQRAQPTWRTYQWKAPDGVSVEGVLIFPPGQQNAKHLRMLTLIHGGPADADGNRFGADWYDWATLAAAHGWLVFRPNYRGSSGYGDDFMLQIAPHIVSKPGDDILSGVDALVRDGIADPDKLAVGGYSYGGYMTNWLITATTRFKAAVTGAGAVEHAANWGNDDVSFDDAWYLGGAPWQQPTIYQSEAALFRMDRVRTPTHIVQGNHDVRVSYLEGVTLERALQRLGIAHSFLVFPGEGHGLGNDPWHGYIKVREELKWLDHYDPK